MKALALIPFLTLPLWSCSQHKPMETVDYVDLDRFMGDWYVIANIPTFIEKGAHNAVETYQRNEDGSIATTFSFNQDSFDGERSEYNPTGYIRDTQSNALWGMQFIWPIEADYRIVYLDENYSVTVIAREARDYIWIMARQPEIPEKDYEEIIEYIGKIGYDISLIERVPQKWPANNSQAGKQEKSS